MNIQIQQNKMYYYNSSHFSSPSRGRYIFYNNYIIYYVLVRIEVVIKILNSNTQRCVYSIYSTRVSVFLVQG